MISLSLLKLVGLKDAIHLATQPAVGQVDVYIGRHAASRVSKAVLSGAITPVWLKSEPIPAAYDAVFDEFVRTCWADRCEV